MTLEYCLYAGAVYGLTQGCTPGPHSTLVITQVLKHDFREGVKVAVAPIGVTFLIVALSLPFIALISHFQIALAATSLAGALFLFFLAYENITLREFTIRESEGARAASYWRGSFAALLSPHPYLFWFTVGTPLLVEAWHSGAAPALAFLTVFCASFVGAKLLLAWLVVRFKRSLQNDRIVALIRVLGVVLAALGVQLLWDFWTRIAGGL